MARPTPIQLAVWRQLQWATALIMARFRRDLSDSGLTIEEFDVLIHLARASEGVLPLRELTASMVLGDSLSRSGLTRLLDRLEGDGLVRRDLDRRDRRRFDVALTPEGRNRFAEVWPAHEEGIGRYFVDPLTQADIAELGRILTKLIQSNEPDDG